MRLSNTDASAVVRVEVVNAELGLPGRPPWVQVHGSYTKCMCRNAANGEVAVPSFSACQRSAVAAGVSLFVYSWTNNYCYWQCQDDTPVECLMPRTGTVWDWRVYTATGASPCFTVKHSSSGRCWSLSKSTAALMLDLPNSTACSSPRVWQWNDGKLKDTATGNCL